jgi:hypothetical protein
MLEEIVITFAHIIMEARSRANLSAAEMDCSLAGDQGAIGALHSACWSLANPRESWPGATVDGQRDRAAALWVSVNGDTELAGMVKRAKGLTYTGWSSASRSPVRYGSSRA